LRTSARADWAQMEDDIVYRGDPRMRTKKRDVFRPVAVSFESVKKLKDASFSRGRASRRADPSSRASSEALVESRETQQLIRQYSSHRRSNFPPVDEIAASLSEWDRSDDSNWKVVKSYLLYSSMSIPSKMRLLALLNSSNMSDVAFSLTFCERDVDDYLSRDFDRIVAAKSDYNKRIQPFAILGMFDYETCLYVIGRLEEDRGKNVNDATDIAREADPDVEPQFHDTSRIVPIRPVSAVESLGME
jgi:hypothetical protein